MGTCRLLGSNMMSVSTRDAETALVFWPTAWTRAVCFDGGKVVCKRCVAKIQGTRGDYGVAEALVKPNISRSRRHGMS